MVKKNNKRTSVHIRKRVPTPVCKCTWVCTPPSSSKDWQEVLPPLRCRNGTGYTSVILLLLLGTPVYSPRHVYDRNLFTKLPCKHSSKCTSKNPFVYPHVYQDTPGPRRAPWSRSVGVSRDPVGPPSCTPKRESGKNTFPCKQGTSFCTSFV